MEEPTTQPFKPPYLSFQTFWGFIHELAVKPLPPSLDRSMLDKKSGTDQAHLLAALKGFGLVTDALAVREALTTLVESEEDQRNFQLAALIRQYYPAQLAISEQHGTEKNLFDSFESEFGMSGDTRRKAVTFFLHAARHAGIPLSAHFPATRSGPGGTAATKAKRTQKRKPSEVPAPRPNPAATPAAGDTYTVNLNSGGSVSIVVTVNIFDLSTDDRAYVIELVDKLKGYPSTADEERGDS